MFGTVAHTQIIRVSPRFLTALHSWASSVDIGVCLRAKSFESSVLLQCECNTNLLAVAKKPPPSIPLFRRATRLNLVLI